MNPQGDDARKADQRLQEVAKTVRDARKALDAAASPKVQQAREASKKIAPYKAHHVVPLRDDFGLLNPGTQAITISDAQQMDLGVVLTAEGVAERPARKSRPVPAGEAVVRRAAREQRKEIVAFFEASGLEHEVKELSAVERRLHASSDRDLRHGAFSARTLLQSVADHLFPAQTEDWQDSKGNKHKVGTEEVGNRLSAYVEIHLGPALESAERRAFQGELDGLMRWTGSGPHGANGISEADLAFTRLLSVLTIVGRAYQRADTARAA